VTVEELLDLIAASSRAVVLPPAGQPVVRAGHQLPRDLAGFYELCGGVEFLDTAQHYGMTISPPAQLLPTNPILIGEQVEDDITSSWYVIGRTFDSELISIDLHAARLGRCYDSFHEVHGIVGSCEIIAASFSAMLKEFLNDPGNGWYWTSPGWPRLGNAYEVP
jgi:hypothetical protein